MVMARAGCRDSRSRGQRHSGFEEGWVINVLSPRKVEVWALGARKGWGFSQRDQWPVVRCGWWSGGAEQEAAPPLKYTGGHRISAPDGASDRSCHWLIHWHRLVLLGTSYTLALFINPC